MCTIGSIYHLFFIGFLFDLFFDPEDGGSAFVRNICGQTTRRYIPEGSTLNIPGESTHKIYFARIPKGKAGQYQGDRIWSAWLFKVNYIY
jgi:hypothetical protein